METREENGGKGKEKGERKGIRGKFYTYDIKIKGGMVHSTSL